MTNFKAFLKQNKTIIGGGVFAVLVLAIGGVSLFNVSKLLAAKETEETTIRLDEVESRLNGAEFSIAVPKRSQEVRSNPSLISFINDQSGKVRLVSVGIFSNVSSDEGNELSCVEMGKPVIFSGNSSSSDSAVEVCENILGIAIPEPFAKEGYALYGTSGIDHESIEGKVYVIQFMAKRAFAESEQGKEELKKIIESFEVQS